MLPILFAQTISNVYASPFSFFFLPTIFPIQSMVHIIIFLFSLCNQIISCVRVCFFRFSTIKLFFFIYFSTFSMKFIMGIVSLFHLAALLWATIHLMHIVKKNTNTNVARPRRATNHISHLYNEHFKILSTIIKF